MIRKLLATTALTAFVATGAYAQGQQAEHEITVQAGDTIIIEAERENAQINLILQSGAAGVQNQTPEQAAGEDGIEPGGTEQQQAETMDRGQFEATDLQQISADDLIGTDVYSAQDENIGNVGDVLLTEDGTVDAIVVDVGGFLGMGANEVALGMEDLDLMTDAQGNLYVYSPYTQEQLEGSPQYDQATWTEQRDEQRMTGDMAAQQQPAQQDEMQQDDQMAADQQDDQMAAESGMEGEHVVADGGTVMVQSDQENFQLNFEVRLAGQDAAQVGEVDEMEQQDAAQAEQADPGVDETETAAIDRDGMEAVDMGQIRADDLIGSDVHGANDDNIGNVGDVLLSEDGAFDAIIVDVGGFLGIGAHEVALGLDEVEFMRDQNENWYVYTGYTQEQLEAAPEYDEATYAEQRDQQRVVPQ
ncbi:MAG: PRC-barrel domain-containing protein [Rhizobiaceae bacterium]